MDLSAHIHERRLAHFTLAWLAQQSARRGREGFDLYYLDERLGHEDFADHFRWREGPFTLSEQGRRDRLIMFHIRSLQPRFSDPVVVWTVAKHGIGLRQRLVQKDVLAEARLVTGNGSASLTEAEYAAWEALFPATRSQLEPVEYRNEIGACLVRVVPLSADVHALPAFLKLWLGRYMVLGVASVFLQLATRSLTKRYQGVLLGVAAAEFAADAAWSSMSSSPSNRQVLVLSRRHLDPLLMEAALTYTEQHLRRRSEPLIFLKSGDLPRTLTGVAVAPQKFLPLRAAELAAQYPIILRYAAQFEKRILLTADRRKERVTLEGIGDVSIAMPAHEERQYYHRSSIDGE